MTLAPFTIEAMEVTPDLLPNQAAYRAVHSILGFAALDEDRSGVTRRELGNALFTADRAQVAFANNRVVGGVLYADDKSLSDGYRMTEITHFAISHKREDQFVIGGTLIDAALGDLYSHKNARKPWDIVSVFAGTATAGILRRGGFADKVVPEDSDRLTKEQLEELLAGSMHMMFSTVSKWEKMQHMNNSPRKQST